MRMHNLDVRKSNKSPYPTKNVWLKILNSISAQWISFSNLDVYKVILEHRNKDHGDEVFCLAKESFSSTYAASHQQDGILDAKFHS